MFSLVQYLVVAAAIATVRGADFKPTNSIQDYYLISQRELLHDIELVEVEVDGVEARLNDRLDVIAYQQQQLLNEINTVNATLYPLQALSLSRKHCIQKYHVNYVTYDDANKELTICYKILSSKVDQYMYQLRLKTSQARNTATTTLDNLIANCIQSNAPETCYTSNVEYVQKTVASQLKATKDLIGETLYDSTKLYQSSVRCSFGVDKNVLEAIRKTNVMLDTCEDCYRKTSANSC